MPENSAYKRKYKTLLFLLSKLENLPWYPLRAASTRLTCNYFVITKEIGAVSNLNFREDLNIRTIILFLIRNI